MLEKRLLSMSILFSDAYIFNVEFMKGFCFVHERKCYFEDARYEIRTNHRRVNQFYVVSVFRNRPFAQSGHMVWNTSGTR